MGEAESKLPTPVYRTSRFVDGMFREKGGKGFSRRNMNLNVDVDPLGNAFYFEPLDQ